MAISIQNLREQKADKLKAAREMQNKDNFTDEDQAAFEACLPKPPRSRPVFRAR